MATLYLPKTYDPKLRGPGIFLAGPIGGAGGWQADAVEFIREAAPQLWIASPHRDAPYRAAATVGPCAFDRQLEWEEWFIQRAAGTGALMFWLPEQREPCLLNGKPKAYARDTRGELGEWRTRAEIDSRVRLVVGGERAFDGYDVIVRNIRRQMPNFVVHDTLRATCAAAVALATSDKAIVTQWKPTDILLMNEMAWDDSIQGMRRRPSRVWGEAAPVVTPLAARSSIANMWQMQFPSKSVLELPNGSDCTNNDAPL